MAFAWSFPLLPFHWLSVENTLLRAMKFGASSLCRFLWYYSLSGSSGPELGLVTQYCRLLSKTMQGKPSLYVYLRVVIWFMVVVLGLVSPTRQCLSSSDTTEGKMLHSLLCLHEIKKLSNENNSIWKLSWHP